MHGKYCTDIGIPRIVTPEPLRVSKHGGDLLFYIIPAVREVYSIPVALAHLPPVSADKLRGLGQEGLRLREQLLMIEEVKPPGYLSCKFQVRNLIKTYRNCMGLINYDIRSLKHRVTQKTISVKLLLLQFLQLVLVSGVSLKPGNRRKH